VLTNHGEQTLLAISTLESMVAPCTSSVTFVSDYALNIHCKPAFVDKKMETSSKGEESSSNKDSNKDKKNEETKEPELVSVFSAELLSFLDYRFIS